MKRIIIIILLISSYISVHAEIQDYIDYSEEAKNPIRWPFSGNLTFNELPQPLKPTRVQFELESNRNQDEDWLIRIYFDDKVSQITTDTIFVWAGPHKVGDKFSGSFEFIPLMSGLWSISMGLDNWQEPYYQKPETILFYWCFNEDGELKYLAGKGNIYSNAPNYSKTIFFTSDSVVIRQPKGVRDKSLVKFEIVIKPAPRLGKPSQYYFKIAPNSVLSSDFRADADIYNMDVVGAVSKIEQSPLLGHETDLIFTFTPQCIKDLHRIYLHFYDCDTDNLREYCTQHIEISLIFNKDGSLRYITDLGFNKSAKELLPDGLPEKPANHKSKQRIVLFEKIM